MTRRAMQLAAAALLISTSVAGQTRDGMPKTGVGTASVTGVVVTDDRTARPLRRARVSITGVELNLGRTTITDDEGLFTFDRLPAGRYTLTAMKEGYVAARPPAPGWVAVDLRQGDAQRATLRLPKGAVITGTVLGPNGEPAAGLMVGALARRFNPTFGERRIALGVASTGTTDDRGVYRIFGLAAGSYLVAANPRPVLTQQTNLEVMSEADVKRALAELKEQAFSSRPGMPAAPPATRGQPPQKAGSVALVPVFFPGTTMENAARPITVAAGEVRAGIDFDLDYVRRATLEGFVSAPEGVRTMVLIEPADPSNSLSLNGLGTAVRADGGFTFRNIPPGHYAVTARGLSAMTGGGRAPVATTGYARTEVIVAGDDISGISLVLRPPLTISGTVTFAGEPGTAPPPPLDGLRVPLPMSVSEGISFGNLPPIRLEGHTFTMASVYPGTYRFQQPPQGIRTPIGRWWLTSFTIKGREMLDAPLRFTDDVSDAVITFTDRSSELSGTVRYATGTPVREGHILVFSTDERTWFMSSRRVAALESSTGRYSVSNLPAGEYYVTVAEGLGRNEWYDRELLAELAKGAARVKLGEFEKKNFDVTLSR